MKKLIFNNYRAEDLGFIVVEGAPEILAQENYEVVDIEGRNGCLIKNKGTYPDIQKTFTITAIDYIDDDNIEDMMNSIKKWFFDIKDNRLFYAFSNKYNIVKKVIFEEDVRTSFEEFGDFQVTFLCEPFYYEVQEPVIYLGSTTEDTSYEIINNGDFESSPRITIYGTGNIGFNLNNELIAVKNVSEFVQIDTKLLTCTDSKGNNKRGDLLSDFPMIQRGTNTITIPSNQGVTKIVINPRIIYR